MRSYNRPGCRSYYMKALSIDDCLGVGENVICSCCGKFSSRGPFYIYFASISVIAAFILMGESPAASVIAFMFIAAAIVLAAMYMMNYKMTPCEIAVTNLRVILHWNGQAEFLDTSHFRDVFILREKDGSARVNFRASGYDDRVERTPQLVKMPFFIENYSEAVMLTEEARKLIRPYI